MSGGTSRISAAGSSCRTTADRRGTRLDTHITGRLVVIRPERRYHRKNAEIRIVVILNQELPFLLRFNMCTPSPLSSLLYKLYLPIMGLLHTLNSGGSTVYLPLSIFDYLVDVQKCGVDLKIRKIPMINFRLDRRGVKYICLFQHCRLTKLQTPMIGQTNIFNLTIYPEIISFFTTRC